MKLHAAVARVLALVALLAVTAAPVAAQQPAPFPRYLVELAQLNEDTYAVRIGGYSSVFITTDEGVILVDPIGGGGNSPNNPETLKTIIAGVTDQPVRYMIYSHSAQDHGAGADAFADTAELVGHRNTLTALEAREDPRMPPPSIAFDEALSLELGGKRVELRWSALNERDSYVTVHYRNVLVAIDNIRLRQIAFSDLPSASPEAFIDWMRGLEADPSWDMFIYGHANGRDFIGTRNDAAQHREYLQDLTAAIREARASGAADNSEEMVAAVRARLAPRYSSWVGFATGLEANIRGVLRWWSM